MNERIKEIATEVGISVEYLNNTKQWSLIEALAERIVGECVNVGLEQKKWVEDQTVFDPRDENWNRARIQQSQHIVDKIKEHFGVE